MNQATLLAPARDVRTSTKDTPGVWKGVRRVAPAERDRLLMEQLPEVRYIARHVHERLPQHVPLEDLVNSGVLGLIEAIHKYDPAKKVQLKTYAKFRIRGAILDSLRQLDWSPRALRRKAREIKAAEVRLQAHLGRQATESELASELKIGLGEMQHLRGELHGLDLASPKADTLSGDGGDSELCDSLPSTPEHDPYDVCLRAEMSRLLTQAVSELPHKQRRVVTLYYDEELTMKAVGAALGVCEGRVSQLHSAAITRLRHRLQELLQSRPA